MKHNLSTIVQKSTSVKDLQLYYLRLTVNEKSILSTKMYGLCFVPVVQQRRKLGCLSRSIPTLWSSTSIPTFFERLYFENVFRDDFRADNPTKDEIQTFPLEMKNSRMKLD